MRVKVDTEQVPVECGVGAALLGAAEKLGLGDSVARNYVLTRPIRRFIPFPADTAFEGKFSSLKLEVLR